MSWCCKCINVHLVENEALNISLIEEPSITFDISIGTLLAGYPTYEGSYEVIPKVRDQIFETRKKSLEENFTVKSITHLETPNSGGGLTVTIGEI